MTGVVREIDVRIKATDMQTTPNLLRDRAIRILPPAAWSVSGALVGVAVAITLGWSPFPTVLAALVGAGLSWLARGIGPLVMTTMLWLAVLALLMQTAAVLVPNKEWSFAWLTPLFFFTIGASLWAGRVARIGWPANTRASSATADLTAALGSLGWALVFVRHLATADRTEAVRFLMGSEDNAAWVNTVATLSGPHGAIVSNSKSFDTFGPVTTSFLGIVRQSISLGSAAPSSPWLNAQAVLVAQALLILAVPLVAIVLTRQVLHRQRTGLTLLTWGTTVTLIGAWLLVLSVVGFLSASLAILLVLVAACAAAELTPRVHGWRPLLGWLVVAFLFYGAAASWVALVPLGGLVIVGWCVALLLRCVRRSAFPVAAAFVVCLPALLMVLALLRQYRGVTDPIGGGQALLVARGGTPNVPTAVFAVALTLLALGWLSSPLSSARPTRQSPLFRSLLWLAAYLVLVSLVEAATTTGAPHYGSQKLLFVLAGAWITLAVVDVLASDEIGQRRLDAAFAVAIAVLVAATVTGGPVYGAAQSQWPKAEASPAWLSAVQLEVATGGRVVCLSPQGDRRGGPGPGTAYVCTRWAASLAGQDGGPALTWRLAMLGRQPVSEAVADIRAHRDLPWKVLVIGSADRLCDSSSWWAPIVAEPGIELISASVSKPARGTGHKTVTRLSCAPR